MKKSYLTFIALTLCIAYGVLSWDLVTHSAPPNPADSQFANLCSLTRTSDRSAPDTSYQGCCVDYNEALDAVKRDWQANLQQLVNQERPVSEMVDDAYESLRTYNCWAEYICRAVEFSGRAPIESAIGTGLKEEHLGVVPGCQAPDNLRLEHEYNKFIDTLKDIPIVGVPVGAGAQVVGDTYGDIKVENKLNFFPRCMTDEKNDNRSPLLSEAKANYDSCKRALEINFGCPPGMDQTLCAETSSAFATLENVLKKRQGDQKAAALEKKLGTIVPKMQAMETHLGYFSNFLTQLDARFACYAGKCD